MAECAYLFLPLNLGLLEVRIFARSMYECFLLLPHWRYSYLLIKQKEQADGDLSNLVCCIMVERQVGLQEAVDILTNMLDDRVTEYSLLKSQLPSFDSKVDGGASQVPSSVGVLCPGYGRLVLQMSA